MERDTSFGQWLRQRRKALDLTQEALSEQVGCSVATIHKIESNARRPSRQIAELLASVLAIPSQDRPEFLQAARGERHAGQPAVAAPVTDRLTDHLLGARPPQLPTVRTPFIGRETELAELAQMLAHTPCRLLTLVGPGGIGKTRLALAFAAQTGTFANTVYFAPLASVSAPEFIVPAIAAAIGLTFYGPTEPKSQLLSFLCDKQALLVLDNIEHLLEGVGLLTELLQHAAGVKLLITSRERLNLLGEWVIEVQGLAIPPSDQAEHLETYSAVALFVRTAQRVRSGFALSAHNRAAVLRICRLVEGMPLGIELAAGWVPTLHCHEIAQEIERNLDFLTASMRDLPQRHRSLRAVFDHSWQLLTPEERLGLCRLSVFWGGFSRAAAEQIAGASLHVLARLVDKSLVSFTPGGRYHLHELLRQLSAGKLQDMPVDLVATRDRHSHYFLAFLQAREHGLSGKQQKLALDEIQSEIENIRAAWSWAITQGQLAALDYAQESLYQFYWLRGYYQEGEEAFRAAAGAFSHAIPRTSEPAAGGDQATELRLGKALARQGAFCIQLGRYEPGLDALRRCLRLARRWEAQSEIAFALNFLGDVAWEQEDAHAAEQLYHESLAIYQAIGRQLGMAEALARLGWLNTIISGEYRLADTQLRQSLALLRAMHNQAGMAFLLDRLGANAFCLGEYVAGERYSHESLALYSEIDHRLGMAKATGGLALAAWGRGGASLDDAIKLFERSLALCRETGHRPEITYRLMFLGHVSNSMGHYKPAQRYFQEALDLARQLGYKAEASWILSGLGEATLRLGDLQAARRYLLEALMIAHALPNILETIVCWGALLQQEAAVSSTTVDEDRLEKRAWAVQMLSLALHHPATRHVYKEKAAQLLAALAATLPPDLAARAQSQGQAGSVEPVVAAILEQAGRQ